MKSHPQIDAYGLKESSGCEAMEKRKLQSIFLQVLILSRSKAVLF
jgi:hypothetical protein